MSRFLSQGKLLDIGSGDGRLVVEAARMGFKSTGVELNRWLVYYSRWGKNICISQNYCMFSLGFQPGGQELDPTQIFSDMISGSMT
mgnify:FL=1